MEGPYIAEIRNKKLCEWKKHPVYEKNSPGNAVISGNMIAFYGTGVNLNLPIGMFEKPPGDAKAEKVD